MIAELVIAGLGLYAAREASIAFGTRRNERKVKYVQAVALARRLRVPLLVVGDPDAGFITKHFGRDYGCGDICVDLTGCPSCPSGRTIRGRLEDVLPKIAPRSVVVFESLTLEYVDDLPKVVRELERITVPGGLFTVRIEPGSSTHWLHVPNTRWNILSERPWRIRRRA